MKKNIFNIIFGVLISGICIYFAFRGINFKKLGESLSSANYLYVIPVVIIVLGAHYLRCYRWGKMLETLVPYDQKTLFILGSIGFMAVGVLPARLGEFARPYLVKKRSGIKMSATMATIIVERVFDLLTLMLFMLIVILTVELPSKMPVELPSGVVDFEPKKVGIIVLTGSLSIFIVLIVLAFKRDFSIGKIDALLSVFPSKISTPINRLAHSFIDGLQILPDIGKTLYVLFLSALIWGIIGLSAYVLFMGFGFELSIINGFAVTVIIALGVMLPAGPGFIGTYHAACTAGMLLFGIEREPAVAYSILLHFFQMMPIVLLGVAMLPFQKISLPSIIQHDDTDNGNNGVQG